MRSFTTISALVGAATASVIPRGEPCSPLGNSSTAARNELANNPLTWSKKSIIDIVALTEKTPAGYKNVVKDATCAASSSKYMLYKELDRYSARECADACSEHHGCDGFNIYVQRDPAVVPGPQCPNPSARAVIKCSLYSEPLEASSCTNEGQRLGPVDANGEDFHVVVRGSNIYNKDPDSDGTRTIIKYVTVDSTPKPTAAVPVEARDEPGVHTMTKDGTTYLLVDIPKTIVSEVVYTTVYNVTVPATPTPTASAE